MRRRSVEDIPTGEYAELVEKVRQYSSRFWIRSGGTELATFRHVARRFSVRLADIGTLVEDCDLAWNCGVQIQGAGYAEFESAGDCTVEPEDAVADEFLREKYRASGLSISL